MTQVPQKRISITKQLGTHDTVGTFLRRLRHRSAAREAMRPDDLFLVGHPKSGNTLAAYALALLRHPAAMEEINLANVGRFVPTVHGRDWDIARCHLASPRCFRNEWPVFPELYPSVVYLVRDPRAVLVSYFHHYRRVHGAPDVDLSSFVRSYLRHGCIPSFEPRLERWDRQVTRWMDRACHQRVLILRYEDLVSDRRVGLEQLAHAAGLAATEPVMDEVLRRTGFDAMRALEDRFGAESFLAVGGAAALPEERFVRQGTVAGWRYELSPADEAEIISTFGPVMSRVGYS